MLVEYGAEELALSGRVRRLVVHHPHGGYCPVTIGYWDQRGYTHCTTCLPDPVVLRGRTDAISGDNCAAEGERCDFCGVSLLAAALEKHGGTDCNTGLVAQVACECPETTTGGICDGWLPGHIERLTS